MEKFVFFGGKGGVGKTTVSSAFAYKCANAGLRTLIVSTDPAHSTGDLFDQEFDDDPRPVEGVENLDAMEIDPEEEVASHLQEIRRQMGEQVSPAMVNAIDVQLEMAHQTPGAYEAALFDRFIAVMQDSEEYDRVVFDTSPTGGTLRLLSLPAFLEGWIDRLMLKRKKSLDRYEMTAIGSNEPKRIREGDPIIARLSERKEQFEFAGRILREDAAFFVVLNPDDLSIQESGRAVERLQEHGLRVAGLVVNKVTPQPDPGEEGRAADYVRQRCATERERIDRIRSEFSVPVVAEIESRVEEVKGDLLAEVAAELGIEPAAVET